MKFYQVCGCALFWNYSVLLILNMLEMVIDLNIFNVLKLVASLHLTSGNLSYHLHKPFSQQICDHLFTVLPLTKSIYLLKMNLYIYIMLRLQEFYTIERWYAITLGTHWRELIETVEGKEQFYWILRIGWWQNKTRPKCWIWVNLNIQNHCHFRHV